MLPDHCLSVCPVLSVCDVGVLWPNGWMDQGETWHVGMPRPWPHCVRWGPSFPTPKGHSPSIFGPYLLWPNGWMDQDGIWRVGRPRPRPHCAGWGPSSVARKGGTSPNFWPMSIVAKWLDALRCHLVSWRYPSAHAILC